MKDAFSQIDSMIDAALTDIKQQTDSLGIIGSEPEMIEVIVNGDYISVKDALGDDQ